MKRHLVLSAVAVLLAGSWYSLLPAQQEPARSEPRAALETVEYKAVTRNEIEQLGGGYDPNATAAERSATLTAGLNILAKDGWRLVGIDQHHEYRALSAQQGRNEQWRALLPNTYVFLRTK